MSSTEIPNLSSVPLLDAQTEQRNIRHLYMDLVWMAFPFALEWYYLQVYAIVLGATPAHLGTLTAVRALLQTVGSLLSNRWRARFANPVAAMGSPLLISRIILYLSIAFVPFLPNHQVDAMVFLVLLSAIPTGMSQGIYLGMMPLAIDKHNLAKIVARRSMLMNVTIMVCVLIVGQFLSWVPKPANYQIGFALAFLASAVSCWHVARIKTAQPPAIPTEPNSPSGKQSVNVWKNPAFVRFAIVVLALNFSVFMGAPIVPLQLVKGLNASDAWISIFGMFEMGAGALFTLRLTAMIRIFGRRKLIAFTSAATIAQVLILSLSTALEPYIIGCILFGVGWYAVNVLLYDRLVESVPAAHIGEYAATYQILINIALFLGPLVGSFMIQSGLTIQIALAVITVLRVIATLLAMVVKLGAPAAPKISRDTQMEASATN